MLWYLLVNIWMFGTLKVAIKTKKKRPFLLALNSVLRFIKDLRLTIVKELSLLHWLVKFQSYVLNYHEESSLHFSIPLVVFVNIQSSKFVQIVPRNYRTLQPGQISWTGAQDYGGVLQGTGPQQFFHNKDPKNLKLLLLGPIIECFPRVWIL